MENTVIKNACYIIDEDRYYRLIGALAAADSLAGLLEAVEDSNAELLRLTVDALKDLNQATLYSPFTQKLYPAPQPGQ